MKLGTRRRTLLQFGAIAPVGAALAACGNRPGGAGNGTTAWALTGGSEQAFRDSFDAWNQGHDDAQITAEYFANDAYKEKIRTAIGSGNAPTLVFGWGGATLADYVENEYVVDLTSDTADLVERVLPSVAAGGMVGDKVYAVPNNQSQPALMYYNHDVIDGAGAQVPETWDDLLSAVDSLKTAGIEAPIALAGQSIWPELMWISYLADRIGGEAAFQRVIDGEAGAWSQPEMLQAAQMVTDLVDADAFGANFASVNADANADLALVYTGKAGMILQGSWVYPTFVTDAAELVEGGGLGFGAFPAVADGAGDLSNIVGNPANYWAVSASASDEAQRSAIEYLSTAVYDDANIDSLLALGAVPPVTGIEDKVAASDNADFLAMNYEMVAAANSFQLSWDQALPSGQAQELLNNLSTLFLGEQSAEQFAEAMDATL